jgi:hypothetical protein
MATTISQPADCGADLERGTWYCAFDAQENRRWTRHRESVLGSRCVTVHAGECYPHSPSSQGHAGRAGREVAVESGGSIHLWMECAQNEQLEPSKALTADRKAKLIAPMRLASVSVFRDEGDQCRGEGSTELASCDRKLGKSSAFMLFSACRTMRRWHD